MLIMFTLVTPSWEPRYPADRLAATGSCWSFMMTLPSLSSGSQAEPTVDEEQVQSLVFQSSVNNGVADALA